MMRRTENVFSGLLVAFLACSSAWADRPVSQGLSRNDLAIFSRSNECFDVQREFEQKAAKMPADCAKDEDCKLFYTHPNSCHRPYVWNSRAEGMLDENFKALQARARTACADRWKSEPACSPEVFPIRCREKKCEEGRSAAAPKPKFMAATIQGSCAPHDASSVMISVTEGDAAFPIFTVNWWGPGRPTLRGGISSISGKSPSMANGFEASFCAYRGGCRSPKTVTLNVEWKAGSSEGVLNYSFTTDEGETFTGSLPLKQIVPKSPVICG